MVLARFENLNNRSDKRKKVIQRTYGLNGLKIQKVLREIGNEGTLPFSQSVQSVERRFIVCTSK